MAILIGKRTVIGEELTTFVSEQDKLLERIVRTWQQSKIDHRFQEEKGFRKAVRRNLKTLDSPGSIGALFTPSNHFFSTKARGRRETLYFKNCTPAKTGRLRQQHLKGPLAKIDKKAKVHLFLSKGRFNELKERHHKHSGLPDFEPAEKLPKSGRYHIEFAYDGKEISGWHSSEGKVDMDKRKLDKRIASALENIAGIVIGKALREGSGSGLVLRVPPRKRLPHLRGVRR